MLRAGERWGSVVGLGESEKLRLLRAACLVIDIFGEDAPRHAALRVAALEKAGDKKAADAWRNLLPVIQRLLRGDDS